jgi:DtxR family Mn-dependent transcriptional regulator
MPIRRPLTWRAFDANEITHSGAHYLLSIAAAGKEGQPPRAAAVARALEVSRAAASLQLRALQAHGFVRVDEHQGLHLTRRGADLVARILSKREVVRVFLEEFLGVDGVVAEADSCKIEHLLSEETGAAIVRFIRFLRSSHPAARASIDAFRQTTAVCPPGATCGLCVESCLLADVSGGLAPRRRSQRRSVRKPPAPREAAKGKRGA